MKEQNRPQKRQLNQWHSGLNGGWFHSPIELIMIFECQEYEHIWGDPLLRNPYLVSEKMRFVLVPCRKCARYFPLFYVKRLIQERKAIKEVMDKISATEKRQLEDNRKGWEVKRFDLWRKHTPDGWMAQSKNK